MMSQAAIGRSGMSTKLDSEVAWLKRVRSGFRYMATVHSQVGTLVYRALHIRSSYSSRSLRLRHWDTTGGQVTLTDDEYRAVIPVYDFGFVHNLHHMATRAPRVAVIGTWYLVAHEWGHYYLAKAGRRNQERDADAFVLRVMQRVGFSEDEAESSEDEYWKIFNADKKAGARSR
jgi:hypothetical protein